MESAFRCMWTRFLLAFLVLALCVGAWAQGGSGELTGLVTDPTGAIVAGVEVKLTNSATGVVRTATTTAGGVYSFPALPIVGGYTLEITAKGFKSVKVENIIVSVGTITSRDVKLEVGAGTEQVTVEAGAQIIQTEDAALSQLVDRRVWENMPLEARNANDFVNLVAGAVPEQQAGGTFRGAAVNGTRTGSGNFQIEGVDNNEQGQGGVAICGNACGQGGANTSISPDAIEEYRVITHDFAAEYGKAGGFVTDTVLKSGTNQWHGSLFEYNRIQALAANDWFSNQAGVQDHLVRNQFGGSVGGPIFKDKTFFYLTAEIHRLRESGPVTGTAMTQQFYDFVNSGGLADFFGVEGLPTTAGPIFQSQLAAFPLAMPLANPANDCGDGDFARHGQLRPGRRARANGTVVTDPNCFSEGLFTSGINYGFPIYGTATEEDITPIDQYRVSVKFDHRLTSKDQLNVTYLFENVHFQCNLCDTDSFWGVPEDNPNRAQTLGIVWTHTFSPTVLNQFKAGYVRHTANFFGPGSEGIPELLGIDANSGQFGGSTAIPQLFTENQFQYKDDISITKGKHQLKFGGEYRRTRNGSQFKADVYGHFYSWSVEDLVTDSVFSDVLSQYFGYQAYYGGWYQAGAAINPTNAQLPDFYRGYRANEVAMYGQDDWRITPRLTINAGLRWEYFGPPHNYLGNIDSNYYFGNPVTPIATTTNNPFFPSTSVWYAYEATATPQVRNTSIWNKDLNNFGPRLGFAWDTLGNQKFVARGGFGVFYDRMYNNIFENIRFNPPFYADENVGYLSHQGVGPTLDPGLLSIPMTVANNAQFLNSEIFPILPKPTPRHMDQNLVTPYYMQWSFGLQYQLAKDFALEASYVGTAGRKLLGILNRNTFDGRGACPGGQDPDSPCALAGFPNGFSGGRPNLLFNSDNARGNYYSSNYNAFDLTLRKRFSRGLSFNANYTYSKALDELSDVFRGHNAIISATDVENIKADYGPSDFDLRHRIVVSLNYDLPVFKGNNWLGGWTVNTITSWSTGSPLGLLDAPSNGEQDGNQDGLLTDRPAYVGPGGPKGGILDKKVAENGLLQYQYLNPADFDRVITQNQAFNGDTSAFVCPVTAGTLGGLWCNGNLSRGAIPGPHFANVDFGISKNFKITERMKMRFDANFFDLFNHPNFAGTSIQGNIFNPGTYGQLQSTFGDTGGHRVSQLALRFDF
ncbi:MAG TPA: carboxypeptidase regulatory-like domain-containing protein [Terriglobales bacterium]|nr:carboxypeptidase regulatory-like domain-containing protein [Terriglobales bacterium]